MYRLKFSGVRRSGKTTTLVNHIEHFLNSKPGGHVLVVTPTKINRDVVHDMLQDRLRGNMVKVRPERIFLEEGIIDFVVPIPSISNPVIGTSYDMIAVDEENGFSESIQEALLPSLKPNGVYIGTYTEND